MAQVPYSPVSTEAPTERGTPSVSINAGGAAFGVNVAEAIGGLGKAVEGAGSELFGRAVALKQLENETEARTADAQYMMQAGMIHGKFNALEGQQRVNALPQYMKDLDDTRTKIRNSLSNPMSMKMYDSSSLSTMGRSIFNGAGAAATANKEAAHSAISATHELDTKTVYDNPNDEASFRSAIARNHTDAATRAALSVGGYSPEREELMIKQGDSTITANRILGMARNNPLKASQLLKQYKDENLLFGNDERTVTDKVQSLTQTVGTNSIATAILQKHLQPDGSYEKSASEMQAEAVKVATTIYPDDPKMAPAAAQAFDHSYNQHQWAVQQDQRAVNQTLNDNIVKGVTSVAMLPPSVVKQMTPTQIKAFPGQANSYQRAEQVQTDQTKYQELLGLYNNDNGKFMDKDIMREPGISKSNMDFFLGLQRKAQANGDPRVSRAMNQIKGFNPQILDDLQVTGKNKDPATANQFVGALHEAIQSWQENNGKAPDEKIITKEIFPAVTRQVTQEGWLWNSKTPFFQSSIPDKYKEEYLKVKPEAKEPEIRQFYARQMFDQFFKSQKATKDQRARSAMSNTDFDPDYMPDPTNVIGLAQRAALGNVATSVDDDPDKAARAYDIAEATGLPASVVHGDLEHHEAQLKAQLSAELIKNNPALQDYVNSHPLAAKVSNDDYGQLDKVSEAVGKYAGAPGVGYAPEEVSPTLQSLAKDFKEGFGDQPLGAWGAQDERSKEFIRQYPYSAALEGIEGLPLEVPARLLSGLASMVFGPEKAQALMDPGPLRVPTRHRP